MLIHSGLFELPEIPRTTELTEVVSGLERGIWYVVYAPQASGKTYFLRQLKQAFSRSVHVKYLNLRGFSGSSTTEIFSCLASAIAPGCSAERFSDLRNLLNSNKTQLVLLIDDAASAAPQTVHTLLNALSALHSELSINPWLRKLGVVLTSGRDLQSCVQEPLSYLNSFQELFLKDFTQAELETAVGEQGREIWRWTGGHPALSALLVQYNLGKCHEALEITGLMKLSYLGEIRRHLPEYLDGYACGEWRDLSKARALTICGIAKLSQGRLVVRNQLIARIIEQAVKSDLTQVSKPIDAGPVDSKLLMNRESKAVYVAGNQVGTTPIEFKILECLLTNSPRVVGKDLLAEAAFPFEAVPSADVESHIKNLRKKLGDDAKNPKFIRCRRGFGYQALPGSFELLQPGSE